MNAVHQQIANLEAFDRITQAEPSPVQLAVNILLNHERNEAEREDLALANERLNDLAEELTAKLHEAADSLAQRIKERDHYQDQCQKMVKKHNDHTDHAQGIINKLEYQVRSLTSELKELRALNPEKLRKKVKELQAKAKVQTEANAKLQRDNNRLKKQARNADALEKENLLLRRDNKQLDLALARAVDDINNGNKVDPLEKLPNGWEIYPDERPERVVILDTETDAARVFSEAKGLLKIRAVPESVKRAALAQIQDIAQRKSGMVDYQGGE